VAITITIVVAYAAFVALDLLFFHWGLGWVVLGWLALGLLALILVLAVVSAWRWVYEASPKVQHRNRTER